MENMAECPIAIVTVPKDANVYVSYGKFRADKIKVKIVYLKNVSTWRLLDKAGIKFDGDALKEISLINCLVNTKNTKVLDFVKSKGGKLSNYFVQYMIFNEAAYLNAMNIIRYMERNGYMLSYHFWEVINTATEYNHLNIVKHFVKEDDDLKMAREYFMNYCGGKTMVCDRTDMVRYLFKNVKDLDKYTENIKLAALIGNIEVVRYFCARCDFDVETLSDFLNEVARGGELKIVKYLHKKGAKLDSHNGMALIDASLGGYLNVVKYLVKNGVDVNICDTYALMNAAHGGNYSTVKYLVEQGADLTSEAATQAMIEAVNGNHLNIVKYLFLKGVKISDLAIRNSTQHKKNLKIFNFFMQNGINFANAKGLEKAIQYDNLKAVKALIADGITIDTNEALQIAYDWRCPKVYKYFSTLAV